MVIAACSDGKHFYTTVGGGSIRKYLINVDDLTQTTDDVFTLTQWPTTCVGLTGDTGVLNTFIIEFVDGNLYLCSPNARVEKSVPAHTGGVIYASVSSHRLSIASGGEDGVVKI
jgi:hypothetical protein